jgi:hypothetical protein
MEKTMGTLRKTLYKHRKFQLQIDANDELSCKTMISRQPYKDRLAENVKELACNCWLTESRVSPSTRDVLRTRITQKKYEEHPKHIFPMTQIEHKFKEDHKEAKISINAFVQQKTWFVSVGMFTGRVCFSLMARRTTMMAGLQTECTWQEQQPTVKTQKNKQRRNKRTRSRS